MVSRYATWGFPIFAATPNSRTIRSTRISRCSSPIPEMMVCPVSSSVCILNVGSSRRSLSRAVPSLSWSDFVLGSIATEITGAGKSIASICARAFHGRNVERGWKVADDGIQEWLDALVLESGPTENGHEFEGNRALAHCRHDLLVRDLSPVDIFLEEPIVDIGDGLQQLLAILLRLFPVFLRDVLDLILVAECFVPVD